MHMIVSHEVTGKNNPCCTRVLQAITEGKTLIFSQVFRFIFKQSMLLTFNTFKVRGLFFFFFLSVGACACNPFLHPWALHTCFCSEPDKTSSRTMF